jgi:hypothetical protein
VSQANTSTLFRFRPDSRALTLTSPPTLYLYIVGGP